MVLQRDVPAVVFGFASAGVTVTTKFDATLLPPVTTDATGVWRVTLPKTAASLTAHTLSFMSSDGGAAALSDVLFGDVHICSGQSNMQFTLKSNAGVPNVTTEVQNANNYPYIRVFTVGQGNSSRVPFQELASIEQPWAVAANTSIGFGSWSAFSAVCWFTYRDLFDALGGTVPQGLISNNWGGTPIQHWSSPDALAKCNGGTDSTLWNAMVVPYTVGPMSIRTGIWYQGEANVGQAQYYDCAMTAMIVDWREKLGGLNTFGIVQIAGYTGYGPGFSAGDLRQAQLSPLRSLSNVAFTTAIDGVVPWSSPSDIHPTNKQLMGTRMSNQLLVLEYGVNAPNTYAFYSSAAASGSGATVSVTVALKGCVAGCTVVPGVIPPGVATNVTAAFAIQTNDAAMTWWNASATLASGGQGLVLTATVSSSGLAAVATSYGRAAWPIVSAYNSLGLPVMPWCYTLAGVPCYNATAGADAAAPRAFDGDMALYAQ